MDLPADIEKNRTLLRYANRIINEAVQYLQIGTTVHLLRNPVRNVHLTTPGITYWLAENYPDPVKVSSTFNYIFGVTTPSGTWPFLATRRKEAWVSFYEHFAHQLELESVRIPGPLAQFAFEAYRVNRPEGIEGPHRPRHDRLRRSTLIY